MFLIDFVSFMLMFFIEMESLELISWRNISQVAGRLGVFRYNSKPEGRKFGNVNEKLKGLLGEVG